MIDWLIGTLLATTALVVLVLLAREPVRRTFGARVAYGLWLIPAARLMMPTLTETVERPVGAPVTPLIMPHAMTDPLLMSRLAGSQQSLINQAGGWPTVLLVLWLGVAVGLFAARLLAFYRERATILRGATELGRIGSIRLVRSSEVSGPLAFGILDRVIAVPADFDRLYDERERRLALEHELAHHRSGDLVVNLFAFGLLCVQWFNPVAWMAHAAFRFDQEAACDARVLDRASGDDRSDYGRAIAKAASGRALLFASALDRRNTLHRRLKSMLSNPTAGRRVTGRMMVLAAIAVALPLTGTRAIHYVDAPAAPAAPAAKMPVAPVAAAVSAAQPFAPVDAPKALHIETDGKVIFNGREKDWNDLTPGEKAEVRRSIDEARQELTRVNREEIQRDIREAMEDARISQEDLRRDIAEAQAEVAAAMREVDANAVELRRSGQDPEQIKATVRASLKAVEAIDVEGITRQALAAVNPAQMDAAMAAAEAGLRHAEAELDRLDALDESD